MLKILMVVPHLPTPGRSGGRLRKFQLVTRLARECAIDLVVISKTREDDHRDLAGGSALLHKCRSVRIFASDHPTPDLAAWRGLLPVQMHRHCSQFATQHVRALPRGAYDVVHVEGFYLMPHVASRVEPVLLFEENVEYTLLGQHAEHADESVRKLYSHQADVTRRHELLAWRRASLCGVVSAHDYRLVRDLAPDVPLHLAPYGADHIPLRRSAAPRSSPLVAMPSRSVVFVANFAYAPSLDGARFLLDEVAPRVWARVPAATFVLVGNSPPPELRARSTATVVVTGRVPDVAPYLDEADVVVCPLRSGGGVKAKTLEAVRRGAPIVATPIAIQGLPETAASVIRVAERPDELATEIVALLTDQDARATARVRTLSLARALPTWDASARAVLTCYSRLKANAVDPTVVQRPCG
jgi:glycosyltransferase involved in cell wall biosynthesis